MNTFTLFYLNNNIGNNIIKLIKRYNLNNHFKSILVTNDNINIFLKYVKKVPVLICNKSNSQIYDNNILEFIIRFNYYINKNKLIPYLQEPSLYSDYYSKFYDNENNENNENNKNNENNENNEINYYSTNGYHNIKNDIQNIKTYTEDKLLTATDFDKKYKQLVNERNA